jgi:hypothetical protein
VCVCVCVVVVEKEVERAMVAVVKVVVEVVGAVKVVVNVVEVAEAVEEGRVASSARDAVVTLVQGPLTDLAGLHLAVERVLDAVRVVEDVVVRLLRALVTRDRAPGARLDLPLGLHLVLDAVLRGRDRVCPDTQARTA